MIFSWRHGEDRCHFHVVNVNKTSLVTVGKDKRAIMERGIAGSTGNTQHSSLPLWQASYRTASSLEPVEELSSSSSDLSGMQSVPMYAR